MRTREAVIQDAKELLEIITTYKVLKLEQLIKVMGDKDQSAKQSVIRLLEKEDRLFIHDSMASAEEKWSKSFDRGMIAAFWVLLDFWQEVLYHTTAGFPAKIEFITTDDAYDIIIAEQGMERVLSTFFHKHRDEAVKHLIVIKNMEQMYRLFCPGIVFCMVEDSGSVSYYQETEEG